MCAMMEGKGRRTRKGAGVSNGDGGGGALEKLSGSLRREPSALAIFANGSAVLTFDTDSTVTLSSLEKICSRERADPEEATWGEEQR